MVVLYFWHTKAYQFLRSNSMLSNEPKSTKMKYPACFLDELGGISRSEFTNTIIPPFDCSLRLGEAWRVRGMRSVVRKGTLGMARELWHGGSVAREETTVYTYGHDLEIWHVACSVFKPKGNPRGYSYGGVVGELVGGY